MTAGRMDFFHLKRARAGAAGQEKQKKKKNGQVAPGSETGQRSSKISLCPVPARRGQRRLICQTFEPMAHSGYPCGDDIIADITRPSLASWRIAAINRHLPPTVQQHGLAHSTVRWNNTVARPYGGGLEWNYSWHLRQKQWREIKIIPIKTGLVVIKGH